MVDCSASNSEQFLAHGRIMFCWLGNYLQQTSLVLRRIYIRLRFGWWCCFPVLFVVTKINQAYLCRKSCLQCLNTTMSLEILKWVLLRCGPFTFIFIQKSLICFCYSIAESGDRSFTFKCFLLIKLLQHPFFWNDKFREQFVNACQTCTILYLLQNVSCQ